jgi:hypothetical protein
MKVLFNIFDHLFTIISEFELEVLKNLQEMTFEASSGNFRSVLLNLLNVLLL